MSVIFQLFSAADLEKLTPAQLDELKAKVSKHLRDPSDQVLARLRKRADQVFNQFSPSPPAHQPPGPGSRVPMQSLAYQLFDARDLANLNSRQLLLLEWALECERDRSPYVLEIIRNDVEAWFKARTNNSQPVPDASYSPYSPTPPYYHVHAANPPADNTLQPPWYP
jgi:hypothetical protein